MELVADDRNHMFAGRCCFACCVVLRKCYCWLVLAHTTNGRKQVARQWIEVKAEATRRGLINEQQVAAERQRIHEAVAAEQLANPERVNNGTMIYRRADDAE